MTATTLDQELIDNVWSHVSLLVLRNVQEPKDVIDLCATAVTFSPFHADSWANYATALKMRGVERLPQVLKALETALQLSPRHQRALQQCSTIILETQREI